MAADEPEYRPPAEGGEDGGGCGRPTGRAGETLPRLRKLALNPAASRADKPAVGVAFPAAKGPP